MPFAWSFPADRRPVKSDHPISSQLVGHTYPWKTLTGKPEVQRVVPPSRQPLMTASATPCTLLARAFPRPKGNCGNPVAVDLMPQICVTRAIHLRRDPRVDHAVGQVVDAAFRRGLYIQRFGVGVVQTEHHAVGHLLIQADLQGVVVRPGNRAPVPKRRILAVVEAVRAGVAGAVGKSATSIRKFADVSL